jgi:hypothetical protein
MQHILEHNLHNRTFIGDVLLFLGGYGAIHVLSQDFGMKTGIKQRNLVQTEPIKFLLHFAATFALLRNYTFSLLATSLYYFFKYIYSRGITGDRCTPDEELVSLKIKPKNDEESGIPLNGTSQCGSLKEKKLKSD